MIKVIKLPKLFPKKKVKAYSITPLGQTQMLWDVKKAKEAKITGITSMATIILLFGLGVLTKELFIMIMVSKGFGKIAVAMFGGV